MADLHNSSLLHLKEVLKWEEHLPHLLASFKEKVTLHIDLQIGAQLMWVTKVNATFFAWRLQDAFDKLQYEKGLYYFADEISSPLGNFMAANPLLCGIFLFQILASIRNVGSSIGHRYQAIQHAGQLYYSCVLQKSSWKDDKEVSKLWDDHLLWEDMSELFDLTGIEAVFHGHIPAENKDIVREFGSLDDVLEKKFCTCCSPKGHYGPVEAAPCQRKQGSEPIHFAKHLCSYEAIAITHRIYFSKHMKVDCCHGHVKEDQVTDWTQETLQALLEQRLEKQRARNDYVTSRKVKSNKKKPIPTSFRDKDGGYTQVSLLRTLKEALSDESRALRFNLLSFHITCFQLMSTLKDRMRHIFDKEDHECHCYDRNLGTFGMAIQVAVNAPERDSRLRKIHSNEDGTLFFNDGHLMIDVTFRSFFAEDAIADEQVKKVDEVWGIAPR